jgi:hypothetical protein
MFSRDGAALRRAIEDDINRALNMLERILKK